MTTRKCNYHPYIDEYIDNCRSGKTLVEKEILLALDLVEKELQQPDVYIDSEMTYKAVELIERYFEVKLFDWELFVVACIHAFNKKTDTVVFKTITIFMGRGNGKNVFISMLSWYLTTHYHGITKYNVDIVANSEEQAKTSFVDVYEMLEDTWAKSKKFFYKSKKVIRNLRTKSEIRYRTASAKTKDGLRPGCVIFDEVHQYENTKMMDVFTSAFGKVKHNRIFVISTDGDVREGVFDEMKMQILDLLDNQTLGARHLPLYYRIGNEEEAENPEMWHKANPSLKYLPILQSEMMDEFKKMAKQSNIKSTFYAKRMNWPLSSTEFPVTKYEYVLKTKKELPDLSGWSCVVGIDYSMINDWASVNLHFRSGEQRYDINHAFVCLQSPFLADLTAPYKEWAKKGHLTLVDNVEIPVSMLTDYILEMSQTYNIKGVAIDNYRYALMAEALEKIGFVARTREERRVYLVQPSDIAKVQPIIGSCFVNEYFTWGNQVVLRWATNNTKLSPSGSKTGALSGTFYYAKISPKTRKNDPFMALVHSMTIEHLLGAGGPNTMPDFEVFTY